MTDTAIVVLAGGRATRYPGKLDVPFEGEPLLMRVCRRLQTAGFPVYVSGSAPFLPAIAQRLAARQLEDRWPGTGPMRALLSSFAAIAQRRVFLVAGDEPHVDAHLLELLYARWRDGIEAVVPRHGAATEPLVALYDRQAAVTAADTGVKNGDETMHGLVQRLRTQFVDVSASYFGNVNTPADSRRAASSAP